MSCNAQSIIQHSHVLCCVGIARSDDTHGHCCCCLQLAVGDVCVPDERARPLAEGSHQPSHPTGQHHGGLDVALPRLVPRCAWRRRAARAVAAVPAIAAAHSSLATAWLCLHAVPRERRARLPRHLRDEGPPAAGAERQVHRPHWRAAAPERRNGGRLQGVQPRRWSAART